jgi:hypothetical protein
MRIAYKTLVGNTEEKRPFEEIGWKFVDWMALIQDRNQ